MAPAHHPHPPVPLQRCRHHPGPLYPGGISSSRWGYTSYEVTQFLSVSCTISTYPDRATVKPAVASSGGSMSHSMQDWWQQPVPSTARAQHPGRVGARSRPAPVPGLKQRPSRGHSRTQPPTRGLSTRISFNLGRPFQRQAVAAPVRFRDRIVRSEPQPCNTDTAGSTSRFRNLTGAARLM